jgi:uncharacterized protein YdgA (DUF945 family)
LNKAFILGGGVTLAALLIAPTFIGNSIETKARSTLAALNEQPLYSASIVSYDKGWFSSSAQIEIALDFNGILAAQQVGNTQDVSTEDVGMENPTIIANVNAYHGPIYFGDGVGIAKVKYNIAVQGEALREYVAWPDDVPLYFNEGKLGLFNGLNYSDAIPALQGVDDELTLNFSGFNGEAKHEGDGIRYQGQAESLSMNDGAFSFEMLNTTADITYSDDVDMLAAMNGELFEGDAAIAIEEMVFSDETGTNILVEALRVITNTDIDEDTNTASVYVEYAVDKVEGAAQDASDMVIGIAINNLDVDFIKAYQDFSNSTLSTPADELPEKLQAFIKDNLLQQLQTEPEINITKLAMTLPEGSFTGKANSKLVGVTALPDTLEDPSYWVSHLLANAQIKADKAFVESMASGYMVAELAANPQTQGMTAEELQSLAAQQVPMVLNTFVEQGFIKQTENGYDAEFVLKDGKANLNGAEIPLPFAQ